MKYTNTLSAIFIRRINRFEALVNVNGEETVAHVKNTGRLKELLFEGAKVTLQKSNNPNRKTAYDLISVYKNNLGWVNIDSQVCNSVVEELLKSKKSVFDNITKIKREYKYGNSRVDFYIECGERKILLEVKGCTLEIDGIGYFPDAPTERGIKHLEELKASIEDGYEPYIAFVIAMPKVSKVLPNTNTHKEFAETFYNATKSGVKVLYLSTAVTENEISINKAELYE